MASSSGSRDKAEHGNYHGYYAPRPLTSPDPRLLRLPKGLFKGKKVLDVGCNEGWVTCEIAQHYGAAKVLGVDIDANLVGLAQQRRRTLWSLQAPETHSRGPPGSADPSGSAQRTDEGRNSHPLPTSSQAERSRRSKTHFPQSMPHMFGPLPIPPLPAAPLDAAAEPERGRKSEFPYNISFRQCDYQTESLAEDEQGWDMILVLSVLKWVHLSPPPPSHPSLSPDTILLHFLQKLHRSLRPSGALVLEVQPRSSYQAAARGNPVLQERLKQVKLRPEELESVLLGEVGFERRVRVARAGEDGMRRDVDVYYKKSA